MSCPKCNMEVRASDKYCPTCGTQIFKKVRSSNEIRAMRETLRNVECGKGQNPLMYLMISTTMELVLRWAEGETVDLASVLSASPKEANNA